ncbi:hypothetical protein Tco_1553542 [Tanacetum coccineum]
MSSTHSTVTYTSKLDINGSPWGIHLMPGYESDASEAAPHSSEYDSPADDDLEPTEAHALPALFYPLHYHLITQFEIGESSVAPAARQPGSTLAQGTIDRLVVTIKETNKRVTDLGTRYRQDIHEIYVHLQDAQDDRAMLRAYLASSEREARYLRTRIITAEQKAAYAHDS